jgi:ribosomal-protein-alanine N-acetyltransferase
MQPVLTTPRLVLRPLAGDDGSHLEHIFASADVRRYLFDDEEVPPERIATIVQENLARRAGGLGLWLIGKDGDIIGCVALQFLAPHTARIFPALEGEIEPIIALNPDQWGEGHATEAMTAILTYASKVLKRRRIVALVDAPNTRSRALMQRCGFTEIGAAQGPVGQLIAYERGRYA